MGLRSTSGLQTIEDMAMTRFMLACFSFLLLLLAGVNPALAFQLDPISQVFSPAGQDATRSYRLINDQDRRIAVEMSVVVSHIDRDGQETNTPAEEDFLLYPSQVILEPGAVQTVRVTWVGDPELSQERVYRLVAEQLPIRLVDPNAVEPPAPVGAVDVLMRYMGSLFVRPAQGAADVQVVATAQPDATGATHLALSLDNQGTVHARLKDTSLVLTAQGTTLTLQGDQLGEVNNALILAGNQRLFLLPWPAGLPVGNVSATLNYTQD